MDKIEEIIDRAIIKEFRAYLNDEDANEEINSFIQRNKPETVYQTLLRFIEMKGLFVDLSTFLKLHH